MTSYDCVMIPTRGNWFQTNPQEHESDDRAGNTVSSVCIHVPLVNIRGGGTDLERGYGDVQPWRPPFHASPAARKGPISSKRVSSQDPLLRKFGNFSLYSLNFHPNFSSQAPKFGNFPLTRPPFQRQRSVRKPHTSEIRAAHPYLKKSWVPPPGEHTALQRQIQSTFVTLLWFRKTEIQDRAWILVLVRVLWVTISKIYRQFWHSFFKYRAYI